MNPPDRLRESRFSIDLSFAGTGEEGTKPIKLYAGKITNNVVQGTARCVMTDGMLRIQKKYPCVLTVHDEVVVLVPEDEAKEAEAWVHAQMIADPKYMSGIPLDAETGCAKRYGEAK